jgi:transposase
MSRTNVSLFGQFLSLIDRNLCNKIIKKYDTDKHSKGINTWTHLVSMVFLQMSSSTSIREISTGLMSAAGNLSHFGVSKAPTKSSISYINQHRTYEVFRDIYFALLEILEPSVARSRKYAHSLKRNIYLMDSTIIPLSLSLFDWAHFRSTKGAIKLHTVLNYDTGLPCYAVLTDGKKHDVTIAKTIDFPKGSVVVMDRAYVDYSWLYNLDSSGVFFVTRLKDNHQHEILETYLTNNKQEHILSDQDIALTGLNSAKKYPQTLRIVKVYDESNQKEMILLTNHLNWTADTISQLYKSRWDIEVFFKHLKQLFHIKSFVGTSANAVQIQMWCSLIAILLLSHIKTKAKYLWHLSNLIAFLRLHLFVKTDLWEWANNPIINREKPPDKYGQLSLQF